MYHVDFEGRILFEKINFKEERIDLIENPLLGPLLRRKHLLIDDDVMTKRANQLAVYYLNLHKRYDLDVKLSFKPKNYFLELSSIQTNNYHGLGQSSLLYAYGENRTG